MPGTASSQQPNSLVETGLETPEYGWTIFNGLVHPKSRGRLLLSGSDATDPILIESNSLSEPEDMAAALAAGELCRMLGNSDSFAPPVKGETAPGARDRSGMINFIQRSAVTYWHQSCTAKMGRDSMSVVDNKLKVYGIGRLRIADASVMQASPVFMCRR